MRTRNEIESEQTDAGKMYSRPETLALHVQALSLEVLLDIRDLLPDPLMQRGKLGEDGIIRKVPFTP